MPKSARERAATALCNLAVNAPDEKIRGEPQWFCYLPNVDAVLRIALGSEAWEAMIRAEGASRSQRRSLCQQLCCGGRRYLLRSQIPH